jgi:hypothetical protein
MVHCVPFALQGVLAFLSRLGHPGDHKRTNPESTFVARNDRGTDEGDPSERKNDADTIISRCSTRLLGMQGLLSAYPHVSWRYE